MEERLDILKNQIIEEYNEAGNPQDQRAMVEQYLYVLDLTKSALPYFFIGQIVSSAFTLLISGCLAYGVTKGKKTFMLPWLIIHFIRLTVISSIRFLECKTANDKLSYFLAYEFGCCRKINHILRGSCSSFPSALHGFVFLLLAGGEILLHGHQGEQKKCAVHLRTGLQEREEWRIL